MRIKALTKYNFSTIRFPIIVFYLCYMGGTLLGSVLNTLLGSDGVVMGVSGEIDGMSQNWSSGIVAMSIFMLVSSLIGSQKDTRFLITRSVSRKEIFVSNAVFLCPLAAIMSALQMVSIHLDGFVRWCMGAAWRGTALDFQIMQAPDMSNIFVFFAVSFSILLTFGAVSFLFGSLMARWKVQTLVLLTVLFILFIALLGITDIWIKIVEALRFMFMDDTTGFFIVLKQVIFASMVMAVSFPVMRKITAAKQ